MGIINMIMWLPLHPYHQKYDHMSAAQSAPALAKTKCIKNVLQTVFQMYYGNYKHEHVAATPSIPAPCQILPANKLKLNEIQ